MLRLFFTRAIGDIHTAFESVIRVRSVRYLTREEKKGLEKVRKPLLGSEVKPLPPKQSVKLK